MNALKAKPALAAVFMWVAIGHFSASVTAESAPQNTNADTPYPAIHASTKRSVIEHGRYLVLHVGVCGHCHSETNGVPGPDGEVHLSGRVGAPFSVPNLTPARTGIGSFSDGAIARALRYNVGSDGRALFLMDFNFSDEDLTAIVSYLRSLKPEERQVPRTEIKIPRPDRLRAKPSKTSPRGISVERGRYLVESVADCGGCHTPRDGTTGRITLPEFSGGVAFNIDKYPDRTYWTANLTRSGRLATFKENDFVARFRAGRLLEGSPMPWEAWSLMQEDDLRSIYRYLELVPAASVTEHPSVEIKPSEQTATSAATNQGTP
jgi:mono/diheme cytochrome c family protein